MQLQVQVLRAVLAQPGVDTASVEDRTSSFVITVRLLATAPSDIKTRVRMAVNRLIKVPGNFSFTRP